VSKKSFGAYKSLSEAIAEHKARSESKAAKKSDLINPEDVGENDVLFGRGGGTNRHRGNIYFRQLVADSQPEYLLCRKIDKSGIANAIVKAIQSKNGRFLKMRGEFYEEVGDNVARLKTSQALREGLAPQRSDEVEEDTPIAMAIAVKDESDDLVYEAINNEAETVDV
jgi:hypothetical protein